MGRKRIAAVAILSTLLMLHDLKKKGTSRLVVVGDGEENTTFSSSELVDNTATVWKSTARSCEARPVHLERGWYKSQSGEDRALQKWFKDICHGTYLEIGGLNGVRFSNSYMYNKGLNWTGVLVEASPRNYQQLVVNRPNEIANVHAGVCEKEMDLHWVESRPAVGGFQEFAAPEFQKQWWSESQIQNAKVVKCRTLEHILLNITNAGPRFYFDFFSLDVEGAELSVLRSVNFDMTAFGVILVEADGHNETKDLEVRFFLESNGYTYYEEKSRSLWFLNNDFWAIYEGLTHS
mmetsp:Transcript_5868/g.8510  ORF Transcript_5868/g.8510 Transcript_5868/m.8510 type:complete len:292 (+) Transcript_5868:93-968(+)